MLSSLANSNGLASAVLNFFVCCYCLLSISNYVILRHMQHDEENE